MLVEACQGQEHPGFQDVLDRSLDTGVGERLPGERILTWVGSQPHLLLEVASGLGNLSNPHLGWVPVGEPGRQAGLDGEVEVESFLCLFHAVPASSEEEEQKLESESVKVCPHPRRKKSRN